MSPIISISINENLRRFLNKLIAKNQYENKSKIIRDALLRLMSTIDYSEAEADVYEELLPYKKNIMGNMTIVGPKDIAFQKKLNKIELEFKDNIVSKNQNFYPNYVSIFMVFEGQLPDFQKIVVDINSIKEVKNFRYLIIN